VSSLLSVAITYFLQSKSTRNQLDHQETLHKKQLDQERELHNRQLDQERELYKGQIGEEREFRRSNMQRENNFRLIEMCQRDFAKIGNLPNMPDVSYDDRQELQRQRNILSRKREELLRIEGIDLIKL
jgi:hypothetical protein